MIQIRPIKEWLYKSKDEAMSEGTICIYCGNLLCGYAEPGRINKDVYRFHATLDIIHTSARTDLTLDEIKDDVECSLKEFIKFIAYIPKDTQSIEPVKIYIVLP